MPQKALLADTEAGENSLEQILVGELPADFIQRPLRRAQFLGDQFPGAALLQDPRRFLDAAAGTRQGFEMSLARRNTAAFEREVPHAGFQMRAQAIQARTRKRRNIDARHARW